MIGLDTNVLLRAALNDDPAQSAVARGLLLSLDHERPGLVSIPVLMEFFWVLRSHYKLPRTRLAGMMRKLLETEHLRFEALEAAGKALAAYEENVADFSDVIIAMRNRELGTDRTHTFDKGAAASIPSMELLA